MTEREQQIADLRRKIKAREGSPAFDENVADLRKRLAELEGAE